MRDIFLSEELLAEIWKRANPRPFESLTVEAALWRAFGMQQIEKLRDDALAPIRDGDFRQSGPQQRRRARKAAKAELLPLVKAGLLSDGEMLFLVDYQRKRVPDAQAAISGPLLSFKGRHETMSKLAQELLACVGFKSGSVRGPAHWANAAGVSVLELWQQYSRSSAAS